MEECRVQANVLATVAVGVAGTAAESVYPAKLVVPSVTSVA